MWLCKLFVEFGYVFYNRSFMIVGFKSSHIIFITFINHISLVHNLKFIKVELLIIKLFY